MSTVSTTERGIDQVHPVGVLDLCVHVQVLMVTSVEIRCVQLALCNHTGAAFFYTVQLLQLGLINGDLVNGIINRHFLWRKL